MSHTARRWYLKLWREPDTGGHWPIIIANLKFATFNICLTIAIAAIAIIHRIAT